MHTHILKHAKIIYELYKLQNMYNRSISLKDYF